MVSVVSQLQSWRQTGDMATGAFSFVVALEWTASAWIPVLVTAAVILMSTVCLFGGFFLRRKFSWDSNVPASEIADPGSVCAEATDSAGVSSEDAVVTNNGAASSEQDGMDIWSILGPGTPKSVRLNRAFCNHGVDYDASLLARFERSGRTGLTAWECSDEYDFQIEDLGSSDQAVASGDPVGPQLNAENADQDRLGSSWERAFRQFTKAELDTEVWISRNNRAYAFHRPRCAIKVTAKRWLTLEQAVGQGKNPCQQCCSDYAKRLL